MNAERHDWPSIVADIIAAFERAEPRRSGLHTLAKLMHREHIQIQRWRQGSEPRHYEGEMLLAIYAELCAPDESRPDPVSASPGPLSPRP